MIRSLLNSRWSHVFSTTLIIVAMGAGLILRDNAIAETRIHIDTQFGIIAFYPAAWSISSGRNFVFRVRNLTERGFPTTIEIIVQTVPATISTRQIFDNLSLERLQTLASYNVISSPISITLPDGSPASIVEYAYADNEADPFLERIPAIIRGRDIITIRRGQAITISYLSNEDRYILNLPIFETFLERLRL